MKRLLCSILLIYIYTNTITIAATSFGNIGDISNGEVIGGQVNYINGYDKFQKVLYKSDREIQKVFQNQRNIQQANYENQRRNAVYQLQRRIEEAKLREIEARIQQIQKVRTPISKRISYQNSGNKQTFIIKGNGEECYASFTKKGKLYRTNCLSLSNSKGIKILCTKHKKICKTEYELVSDVGSSRPNYFITEKGTKFRVTYNKHGAILKSRSFTIYVGKSCDVTSSAFGTGIWKDGRHMGFSIQFNNKEIVFPKQQIHIKNNAQCI